MRLAVSAAIVAALVIISATLASRPSSEGHLLPTTSAAPKAEAKREATRRLCDRMRPRLRAGLVDRRSATWRWQDALFRPRSRTSYPERWARGCGYLAWARSRWARRADEHYRLYVSLRDPIAAIRYVFGRYADEAIDVASCESRLRTTAVNGQYLGMFQMGSSERAIYGHGSTPLDQARAAHRYFVASGRDWSPWQCRPGGRLGW